MTKEKLDVIYQHLLKEIDSIQNIDEDSLALRLEYKLKAPEGQRIAAAHALVNEANFLCCTPTGCHKCP